MRPLRDGAAISGEERGARGAEQDDQQRVNGNSRRAQQQRLLEALRIAPVSTFDARSRRDIAHPAARVCELRELGFSIATLWSTELSESGTKHRVAKYALIAEPRPQEAHL